MKTLGETDRTTFEISLETILVGSKAPEKREQKVRESVIIGKYLDSEISIGDLRVTSNFKCSGGKCSF